MGLRRWSWDAQWGPAGLGDRTLLEALQAAIPDETVDAVIEATGTREQRRRRLPTHVVVTLVVAMGLWASESVRHALANVVAGWREGAARGGSDWQLPTNAALVRARQRAGARLFLVPFQSLPWAGPIPNRCPGRPGSWRMAPPWPLTPRPPLRAAPTATGPRWEGSSLPWTPPPVRARTSTGW